MTRQRGDIAEEYARDWLNQQQLKIIAHNFHSRFGEIDVIALDGNTLCFIEIRYRQNDCFGSAIESVTQNKQHKIIKTAYYFLNQNPAHDQRVSRFDIVALSGDIQQPTIDWRKNAFMIAA